MKIIPTFLLSLAIAYSAFADDKDKVVRDPNGNIIARIDNTATGKVVRDANGKIIARANDKKNASAAAHPKK